MTHAHGAWPAIASEFDEIAQALRDVARKELGDLRCYAATVRALPASPGAEAALAALERRAQRIAAAARWFELFSQREREVRALVCAPPAPKPTETP